MILFSFHPLVVVFLFCVRVIYVLFLVCEKCLCGSAATVWGIFWDYQQQSQQCCSFWRVVLSARTIFPKSRRGRWRNLWKFFFNLVNNFEFSDELASVYQRIAFVFIVASLRYPYSRKYCDSGQRHWRSSVCTLLYFLLHIYR